MHNQIIKLGLTVEKFAVEIILLSRAVALFCADSVPALDLVYSGTSLGIAYCNGYAPGLLASTIEGGVAKEYNEIAWSWKGLKHYRSQPFRTSSNSLWMVVKYNNVQEDETEKLNVKREWGHEFSVY